MISGSSDFILIQKLRNLKKDITIWNKEVFGKLETRRNKVLAELSTLEKSTENRSPTMLEKQNFFESEKGAAGDS